MRACREGDVRLRDHCHITGKYRGAAHQRSNLMLPQATQIPVFFHNLRGYDAHILFPTIGNYEWKIKVIPQTWEKYLAIQWGRNIIFKDSLQFMNQSLSSLVKNLKDSGSQFPYLNAEFPPDKAALLLRKGVYPYEYMSKWRRFQEDHLPPS